MPDPGSPARDPRHAVPIAAGGNRPADLIHDRLYSDEVGKMRALLVDADLSAAHAIDRMLRDGGIMTDHADCGRDALELTRRHDYDVILFDLAAAGGDGCRFLRQMHESCATPVLALSASAPGGSRLAALASGAADYMAKPFGRVELTARLRAMVRHAPAAREASLA